MGIKTEISSSQSHTIPKEEYNRKVLYKIIGAFSLGVISSIFTINMLVVSLSNIHSHGGGAEGIFILPIIIANPFIVAILCDSAIRDTRELSDKIRRSTKIKSLLAILLALSPWIIVVIGTLII